MLIAFFKNLGTSNSTYGKSTENHNPVKRNINYYFS